MHSVSVSVCLRIDRRTSSPYCTILQGRAFRRPRPALHRSSNRYVAGGEPVQTDLPGVTLSQRIGSNQPSLADRVEELVPPQYKVGHEVRTTACPAADRLDEI